MAWWHFGKKRRKDKSSPSADHKNILDEKRSALSSPTSAKAPLHPRNLGATPYELQRSGTPPIHTDAPVKPPDRQSKSLPSSPKAAKKVFSGRHSRSQSQDVAQVPSTSEPLSKPTSPSSTLPTSPEKPEIAEDVIRDEPIPSIPSSPQQPSEEPLTEIFQESSTQQPLIATQEESHEPPQQSHLEPSPNIPNPAARSPARSPQKQSRRNSVEDITALPASRHKLERSPHLRPVPDSDRNIIAGSRGGKSGSDRTSSNKKNSVKRRKEDAIREEQVKAMTSPVPIPKRAESPQLFRRDSKRMRDDLTRPGIDPTSTVSLPGRASARSSIAGMSETNRLGIGFIDILSPRPKARFSLHGQYTADGTRSGTTSRLESRPETRKISPETLKESKTIDELADDMDTRNLREMMERDRRRRDKKRKSEEERARRRLERYAARAQREEEARLRDVAPPVPPLPSTLPTQSGTAGPSGTVREYPTAIIDQPETSEIATDPFQDPQAEAQSDLDVDMEDQQDVDEGPFADPSTEIEATSPSEAEPPGLTRRPSDLSEIAEVQGTSEPAEMEEKSVEPPNRRGSGIAALFRKSLGKRDSTRSKRSIATTASSYSTRSRESAPDRTYRRTSTGMPTRTTSIFKENLPQEEEQPLESPEKVEPAQDVGEKPEILETETEPVGPLPTESSTAPIPILAAHLQPGQTEAESSTAHLSQSLASVDSEGSWLSGRPRKRTSQQMSINLSPPLQRRISGDTEELLTPSTEAYHTPTEETPIVFASPGNLPEHSFSLDQTASAARGDETQVVKGDFQRTPKVVQPEERVQSTAGLLHEYDDENEAEQSDMAEHDVSSDDPSPGFELEEAQLAQPMVAARRASHARQISAGSARLLDIPPKRDSLPPQNE